MSRYLDAFKNTLSQRQAKQIMLLLERYKNTGVIKSVQEYNKKLNELAQFMSHKTPSPSFKFFEAIVGELIDADKYNAMLTFTKNDLEALFGELEELTKRMAYQEELHKFAILRTLDKAITELENKVSLYEFVSAQGDIDTMQAVFFNSWVPPIATSEADRKLLFDPRLNEEIPQKQKCLVDLNANALVLPTKQYYMYKPSKVEIIWDADTTPSHFDVTSSLNPIKNLIDGQKFTYWTYYVVRKSLLPDGAKIKLRFHFDKVAEINHILIEPTSTYPATLDKMIFTQIDENSQTTRNINVVIANSVSATLETPIKASFIDFVFSQKTANKLDYYYNPEINIWEAIENDVNRSDLSTIIDPLKNTLTEELSNDVLADILGVNENKEFSTMNAYQYEFGFDNFIFDKAVYEPRGIFVGEELKSNNMGIITFAIDKTNISVIIGASNYDVFSFEYYLLKQDYDENDSIVYEELIPIWVDANEINERLLLVLQDGGSTNNVGSMRFAPSLSPEPIITKNFTQTLTIGTDYVVSVNDGSWQNSWNGISGGLDDKTKRPSEIKIKIAEPEAKAIYTIRYTPSLTYSDNTPRYIAKRARVLSNGVIECSYSKIIKTSKIRPIIIIRNNYIEENKTPLIKTYFIGIREYNKDKFTE